jgi:aerobic carbon-monoxide dehydrogenase medium subunit
MHQFRYATPGSLEELLNTLADRRDPVKLLAGGTDLIVQMRSGAMTPELVIDVKQIPELNCLSFSDKGLTLGAAVSCRTVCENKQIARAYPALIESASLIGGIQIQGRASIGGNLCNASPSADSIPTLIVLGAVAKIRSSSRVRDLAVEGFCTSPGTNVLADDEVLVSLTLPKRKKKSGAHFLRFTPRNEMDIAVANAAASVVLSADGKYFTSTRIAIGAVGPTPILVQEAAEALQAKLVSTESVDTAAKIARQTASPINDMRGSARQRKHLVEVLVRRALHGAIERARSTR